MKTREEILSELKQFIATEQYYKVSHITNLKCTDGVQYLREVCNCYWLTDIIGENKMYFSKGSDLASLIKKLNKHNKKFKRRQKALDTYEGDELLKDDLSKRFSLENKIEKLIKEIVVG